MLETFELKAFSAVAKHLNFARAAQDVGLSAPQFSKVIANLEFKIKTKLLLRSTRSVRLTEEGRVFLHSAQEALNSVQVAEQLFETSVSPREMVGSIRLTAPTTLGTRFLGNGLVLFQEQYPRVEVKVILADEYLDFVKEDIDVALRVMAPSDTDMVAKKIGSNNVYFFAAPEYLKSHMPIESVDDLIHHRVYAISPHWNLRFEKRKMKLKELIKKGGIETTNGDLLVELACARGGVVVRPEWSVLREIERGQLMKISLNDQLVSDSGIYIVVPKDRNRPARVTAFIKVLEKSLVLTK